MNSLAVVLVGLALLAACTTEAPVGPCSPGDTQACLGLGGCQGTQACQADGSGFGECACTAGVMSGVTNPPTNVDAPGTDGQQPMTPPSMTGGGPDVTDGTPTDGAGEVDGTDDSTDPGAGDDQPPEPELTDAPTDVMEGGLDASIAEAVPDAGGLPTEPMEPAEPPRPTEPEHPPVVVFLLDQSSSMFPESADDSATTNNWEVVRNALSTIGAAVEGFEVGLMTYTGQIDGTCPFIQEILEPGVSSWVSITYTLPESSQAAPPFTGQTPTGESLERALNFVLAADLPGKKHIIVLTDGDPDTCRQYDPQCGQDFTVSVAQQAYAAGVSVHAVGITTEVQQPFLESLAYAGRGRTVPPPLAPEQQGCLQQQSNSFGIAYDPNNWRQAALAEYGDDDVRFDESLAHVATNEDELSIALKALLEFIRYDL